MQSGIAFPCGAPASIAARSGSSFLPVTDMDYGEDLYIKMNSRGKPLTIFEVFKAGFESALVAGARAATSARTSRIDSIRWRSGLTFSGSTRRPAKALQHRRGVRALF